MSVRLSAFAHSTEDVEKVERAILNICPNDTKQRFQRQAVKGHFGNNITICRLLISGRSEREKFLNHLRTRLSESERSQFEEIVSGQADRTGPLQLRLDKQLALRGEARFGSGESIKVEVFA